MGSKNITKQIKPILLSEVIKEAHSKNPGYNRTTAMLMYYNLLIKICSKKRDTHLIHHLQLLTLLMNGIEYFNTEGRN